VSRGAPTRDETTFTSVMSTQAPSAIAQGITSCDALTHLRRRQPVALEQTFVDRSELVSGRLEALRCGCGLEFCPIGGGRHGYQYQA
jgi:hypothetical protein